MHIVISGSVCDQQFATQLPGFFNRRRRLVTLCVLRQQSQIPLRVNRVVVAPVRDWSARESCLEILRVFKHGVQRHVPAVAPSPNSDSAGVYPRLPF